MHPHCDSDNCFCTTDTCGRGACLTISDQTICDGKKEMTLQNDFKPESKRNPNDR